MDDSHDAKIALLKALIEALERDSARYQWLRSLPLKTISLGGIFVISGEHLDAAIDRAMAKDQP